ncbi:hypothetical protein H4R33_007183, partial [Dimargaris cristalligena]
AALPDHRVASMKRWFTFIRDLQLSFYADHDQSSLLSQLLPLFAGVKHLVVDGDISPSNLIPELAESFNQLTHLTLTTPFNIAPLFDSHCIALQNIRSLDLYCPDDQPTLRAISSMSSTRYPHLYELSLFFGGERSARNEVKWTDFRPFFDQPWPNLTRLTLQRCEVGGGEVGEYLATNFSNLRFLSFSNFSGSADALACILIHCSRLTTFHGIITSQNALQSLLDSEFTNSALQSLILDGAE